MCNLGLQPRKTKKSTLHYNLNYKVIASVAERT